MIIYIYAYLLYNINQAYIIIPEKSKAGGKRRINCPLPLHFIARSFINPRRELVSRYFTMGAGALVNPRFFDERARSEQLRFSKTPKRSRDHGTGHRQLPAARRLNKGWTLPLPAVSRAWSRVQLAFTLERLPRPTGLSGESRHRYLVSVPCSWKYPPISRRGRANWLERYANERRSLVRAAPEWYTERISSLLLE